MECSLILDSWRGNTNVISFLKVCVNYIQPLLMEGIQLSELATQLENGLGSHQEKLDKINGQVQRNPLQYALLIQFVEIIRQFSFDHKADQASNHLRMLLEQNSQL
eukprot:NODE_8162_length_704_cov_39.724613_g7543_i0.p1 GENE.NODE_8162_length_704_cov_39.724613_g7543_i0~~NODE_8162_length_704_cov_39.724613_g7543_i0.p1  ORF type:complete len:106 (-),score=14.15 NODE_8162_length_704_cov_39.724613_g7543_i0:191-508(-)